MLRPLYLEAQAWCLKVQSLHQKLRVWHLHWHLRPVHQWWFEGLIRLREARPNDASARLSMEQHLPPAILLHLHDLVFNNHGLVNHLREVYVVLVEQLELNIIIQSTQEHVMFLFIHIDVVRGVSC
jgi:hypothetical protein